MKDESQVAFRAMPGTFPNGRVSARRGARRIVRSAPVGDSLANALKRG